MQFEDYLDPQVVPALTTVSAEMMTAIVDNPLYARQLFARLQTQIESRLPPTNVTIEELTIAGPGGDLRLVIYQPPSQPSTQSSDNKGYPALLWMHGGGYIIGEARDDLRCIAHAEYSGCKVISVDYRMAPEHPAPAGIEDCYAALLWLAEHAQELGVDASRLAIGGSSAGGGMAASLALMNRDRNGPDLKLQLLIYPMLDDTHDTPSGHFVTHPNVWHRDISLKAWQMYLGNGDGGVSPYAAAARATNLCNLPPAYISVGSMDLFRDENIAYASRLLAAGVATELQVYPGCFHDSENLAPHAAVSLRMKQGILDALNRFSQWQ